MKLKLFLSLLVLAVTVALWAKNGTFATVAASPSYLLATEDKADVDTTKKDARDLVVFTDIKDHITHEAIKGIKAELLWLTGCQR